MNRGSAISHVLRCALAFAIGLCPAYAAAQAHATSLEMTQDRAHQDKAIHWPALYDPSVAPVFSNNEALIHAGCPRVFAHFIDAQRWPDSVGFLKDVSFETAPPMQNGSLLKLTIFGSPIQSRVIEFVPNERVSWIPFGADETETRHGHYHAWHFVPAGQDCRVVTEETGIADFDRKDPAAASHYMHKAHDLWLAGLRYSSEP